MEKIPVRHLIAPPKEPDLSGNFSIRDIQSLLAGEDLVQELHRHDFFYLLALKEGAGVHDIDFNPYVVCENSVFFMRPGQVHRLILKAGSTGYLMQFKSDFHFPHHQESNQLLFKASNMNLYQLDADKFQKLLALLAYIFQEYTTKQERYQAVINANLSIFFIELIRQVPQSSPNNISPYIQERLETFLELLHKHVLDHKQVSWYAAMMHVSSYQLNAITKITLGKTCIQIINEHILLEARRHLLATSSQINQIAYHLGYEDVSYFIRFFKKHIGQSPEAFRQNFR